MTPLLILGLTIIGISSSAGAEALKIKFDNLRNSEGSIRYLVFKGPDGYPDDPAKGVLQGSFEASQANEGLILNLPPGNYAVTVIHDENNNEKLDTNFLGMPTEGFGFSNNPRIFFGAPSFEKTKFEFPNINEITIHMKYF